jgi:hypothetical protein
MLLAAECYSSFLVGGVSVRSAAALKKGWNLSLAILQPAVALTRKLLKSKAPLEGS